MARTGKSYEIRNHTRSPWEITVSVSGKPYTFVIGCADDRGKRDKESGELVLQPRQTVSAEQWEALAAHPVVSAMVDAEDWEVYAA